jgi:hypothetical protein
VLLLLLLLLPEGFAAAAARHVLLLLLLLLPESLTAAAAKHVLLLLLLPEGLTAACCVASISCSLSLSHLVQRDSCMLQQDTHKHWSCSSKAVRSVLWSLCCWPWQALPAAC